MKSGELSLILRPEKCVSFSFDGLKMKSSHFTLTAGSIASLQENSTKIFGQTLGKDLVYSRKVASNKLSARFKTALPAIDSQSIHCKNSGG